MSMSVYLLAQKYYPRLWDENRINALFEAGKLTEEEYNNIIKGDNEE